MIWNDVIWHDMIFCVERYTMDVFWLIFVQAVRLLTEDAPAATTAIPVGPVHRPIPFSSGQSCIDISGKSINLFKSDDMCWNWLPRIKNGDQ